ncbi:LysE family translocator [Nocardioides sp. WS12]|uniref:LysE family translocator n=1 Tax=Nocardioides sp. WS12 TaxID=2486272 RepID=UPI0015FE739E|nr:LysE family translocator [Nocardioides sp. WS12]
MPSSSQFAAFAIASILFIQVPGPSLLFTIGRALTVGRRDALLSVVGNALGLVAQVILVAIGLGAVVAASATAFTIIKLIGAAYVIYLGVQAFRHRADARAALEQAGQGGGSPGGDLKAVRTGFVVGATNPKTIVFFVAFLPQFIDSSAAAAPQLVLLGVLFGVMAVASDTCWALAASRARDWFARKPERLDTLGAAGGVMMVGLGAALVTTNNH